MRLRLRGLQFKERHRSEISDAEILRLDVLQIAAKGLSVVDSIRGADFQTRQLLLALGSGSSTHIAHALCLEATYNATNGKSKRAAQMFARAKEIAGDETDAYMLGLLAGSQGIAAYFRGDAPSAIELVKECEATLRRVPGASWELASTRICRWRYGRWRRSR